MYHKITKSFSFLCFFLNSWIYDYIYLLQYWHSFETGWSAEMAALRKGNLQGNCVLSFLCNIENWNLKCSQNWNNSEDQSSQLCVGHFYKILLGNINMDCFHCWSFSKLISILNKHFKKEQIYLMKQDSIHLL